MAKKTSSTVPQFATSLDCGLGWYYLSLGNLDEPDGADRQHSSGIGIHCVAISQIGRGNPVSQRILKPAH